MSEFPMKFHKQKVQLSIVYSVVMFEAWLTLKSLKPSSFPLANAVKNLRGEIFRIRTKFPITWIPTEMIGPQMVNVTPL